MKKSTIQDLTIIGVIVFLLVYIFGCYGRYSREKSSGKETQIKNIEVYSIIDSTKADSISLKPKAKELPRW